MGRRGTARTVTGRAGTGATGKKRKKGERKNGNVFEVTAKTQLQSSGLQLLNAEFMTVSRKS
jgi:hypothetical protein